MATQRLIPEGDGNIHVIGADGAIDSIPPAMQIVGRIVKAAYTHQQLLGAAEIQRKRVAFASMAETFELMTEVNTIMMEAANELSHILMPPE